MQFSTLEEAYTIIQKKPIEHFENAIDPEIQCEACRARKDEINHATSEPDNTTDNTTDNVNIYLPMISIFLWFLFYF